MKKFIQWICILSILLTITTGCNKTEFLDKKPLSSILQPVTVADYQQLLENTNSVFNFTGALAQIGSDDYTLSNADYQTFTATERNSYIWAKDIYGGDVNIPDWSTLYKQVFYCNVVLDGLSKSDAVNTPDGQFTKGWALFNRAYALYDLTRNFCKSYDAGTAGNDLGMPLRLSPNIDYLEQRATLQKTFDQIFQDLESSIILLPAARPSANLNHPSKIAVYALLARIYLDMRDYTQTEIYTDKCLNLYSKLIDYNSISLTATAPFPKTNDELIYSSTQVFGYNITMSFSASKAKISPELLSQYSANDLRLPLYFIKLIDGTYVKKPGYNGANYPFTGLATDELYLTKAECLARRNEVNSSMDVLNQLLIKRWNPNATASVKPYQNLTANSSADALSKILLERRKELVWRGLRWHDLKRLNKGGANITLSRVLNGITYLLPPNDPRYVFPIPDDEIALSSIQQNNR